MTYKELLHQLQTLPEEKLNQECLIVTEEDYCYAHFTGDFFIPSYYDEMANAIKKYFTGFDGLTLMERALVVQDYMFAERDEGISVLSYGRRIGKGNIKGYAKCLVAGQKRRNS